MILNHSYENILMKKDDVSLSFVDDFPESHLYIIIFFSLLHDNVFSLATMSQFFSIHFEIL